MGLLSKAWKGIKKAVKKVGKGIKKVFNKVTKAIGKAPDLPPALKGLEDKESRCEVLEPDIGMVQDYIARNALL